MSKIDRRLLWKDFVIGRTDIKMDSFDVLSLKYVEVHCCTKSTLPYNIAVYLVTVML